MGLTLLSILILLNLKTDSLLIIYSKYFGIYFSGLHRGIWSPGASPSPWQSPWSLHNILHPHPDLHCHHLPVSRILLFSYATMVSNLLGMGFPALLCIIIFDKNILVHQRISASVLMAKFLTKMYLQLGMSSVWQELIHRQSFPNGFCIDTTSPVSIQNCAVTFLIGDAGVCESSELLMSMSAGNF